MLSECQDSVLQLGCTQLLHRGVVGEELQTRRGEEEGARQNHKGVEEQQHQKEGAEESPLTGLVDLRILQEVVHIIGEDHLQFSQVARGQTVWPRTS